MSTRKLTAQELKANISLLDSEIRRKRAKIMDFTLSYTEANFLERSIRKKINERSAAVKELFNNYKIDYSK